jgi:hypothetical protein
VGKPMNRYEAEQVARDNFYLGRLAEADRMMAQAKELIEAGSDDDIRRGYQMREAARLLYSHVH